jgi:predicted transcriptional regulator
MTDRYRPTSGLILRALRDGRQATVPELEVELGRERSSVRRCLYRLIAQGRIERVGLRHTDGRGRPAYLYRRTPCLG